MRVLKHVLLAHINNKVDGSRRALVWEGLRQDLNPNFTAGAQFETLMWLKFDDDMGEDKTCTR